MITTASEICLWLLTLDLQKLDRVDHEKPADIPHYIAIRHYDIGNLIIFAFPQSRQAPYRRNPTYDNACLVFWFDKNNELQWVDFSQSTAGPSLSESGAPKPPPRTLGELKDLLDQFANEVRRYLASEPS